MGVEDKPLVIVHWLDAEASDPGWTDEDDFNKWCDSPIKAVMTVGWLVRDTDDRVVVMSTDGGTDMGEAHKIPKSWVVKIEKLTVVTEASSERNMSNTQWGGLEHPQPGP